MSKFVLPHYQEHDHLEKQHIEQVIYQVSFPVILSISEKVDSRIQEELRDFPIYQPNFETEIITNFFENYETKTNVRKFHDFISLSDTEKVTIREGSVSVSTLKYTSWADFFRKVKIGLSAFEKIYTPVHYSRVDLRYINVFESDLFSAGSGKTISDLVQPNFAGAVPNYQFPDPTVVGFNSQLIVNHDEVTSSNINYGLGTKPDRNVFAFLLDTTVYSTMNRGLDSVYRGSERLHDYAYDVFRWVIKDEYINDLRG